jgi:hypothetical protein
MKVSRVLALRSRWQRGVAMTVAAVVALLIGAQQPALANGPEGLPVTLGAYYPNSYVGSVHTPLSLPYQWLDRGNTWSFGNVDLVMQTDGNLVMYRHNNHSIVYWASNTSGSGATQLLLQRDGNLVLYTAGYARAVWASHTPNKCYTSETPAISLQSDSNFVIYCRANNASYIRPIWATGTNGV